MPRTRPTAGPQRLTPNGKRTLKAIQAAQTAWADDLGAWTCAGDIQEANEVLGRALATLSQRQFDVKSVSSQ